METTPGIYRFATGRFNWYVIAQGHDLTLVDAGLPGHFSVLEKGLGHIGRQWSDIKAVILTHAHADHIGFAQRAATAAGAPIYIHAKDTRAAERGYSLPWWGLSSNAWRSTTRAMLLQAAHDGVFTRAVVENAKAFADGDVLDVPGSPRVIHTPGHTPGHVSFHLPDRHVLIAGDALATIDIFSGRNGTPVPLPAAVDTDARQARSSIAALRNWGKLTLLPGHGPPWLGSGEEMARLALGEKLGPSHS